MFSALNQCGKILLKSFSYLYEVRRTNVFADFFGVFSIFDRNFAKTVPPFSNEYEKSLLSNASERVITPEKPWKQHQNQLINHDTIFVHTRLCPPRAGRLSVTTNQHHIFAPTAGVHSLISKLCMVIEDVVTILEGVNFFSIERRVFPTGVKTLIFGYWRTE